MAHEIENAVRREGSSVSWHGLEVTMTKEEARDLDTFMRKSGFFYTVTKHGLVSVTMTKPPEMNRAGEEISPAEFEYVDVPSHCALRRSTDGTLLGVMGADYEVHNPQEVLAPIHSAILADERFAWNFGTTLRDGKIITAVADYVPDYTVAEEAHNAFLFASTSFDGSRATEMGGSTVRIVCANTLRMSQLSKDTRKIVLKHRSPIAGQASKLIRQIEDTVAGFLAYKDIAEALAQHRMAEDLAKDMLTKLLFVPKLEEIELENGKTGKAWSKPATRTQGRIDKLIESFETSKNERSGESNLYTMLQAVTRFADHERGVRMTKGREATGETEAMVRFDSNLLGNSDSFKQEAFKMLLEQGTPELQKIAA